MVSRCVRSSQAHAPRSSSPASINARRSITRRNGRASPAGSRLDDARRQPDGELYAGDRAGRRTSAGIFGSAARLTWPPPGRPGYDMTGLDLRNVHLRSTERRSNLAAGECRRVQVVHERDHRRGGNSPGRRNDAARRSGAITPLQSGLRRRRATCSDPATAPRPGASPKCCLIPRKYSAWPKRIRVLRDGRLVVIGRRGAGSGQQPTRAEYSRCSSRRCWSRPIRARPGRGRFAVVAEQSNGWTRRVRRGGTPQW